MTIDHWHSPWVANTVVALMLSAPIIGAKADPPPDRLTAFDMTILPDTPLFLSLPKEERVSFHGVVKRDDAGIGALPILYPAPNVVGALAAVVTHGFMNEAIKNAQNKQLQHEADKAISQYQAVISNFRHAELLQRTLTRSSTAIGRTFLAALDTADTADTDLTSWRIDSVPSYLITQDQRAIVLQNTIAIFAPEKPKDPVYLNTIVVVSRAIENTPPDEYWMENGGVRLKDESATLLAESVAIALTDLTAVASPEQAPFRTVRYREGLAEKIERAQLLKERCSRLLIRSLRGWLKSVPVNASPSASIGNCEGTGTGLR